MKKTLSLVLSLIACAAFAAEVDLDTAKAFAKNWRGKGVRAARTHRSEKGESRFHVVNFEGGGWAAVGVEDEEAPVIAFSDNGEDLVEDENNAVWFLVKRDAERRAKAREVRGEKVNGERVKGERVRHKGWERKRSGVGERVNGEKVKGEGGGRVKLATVKTGASTTSLYDVRVAPLVQSTWDQKNIGNYSNYPTCYNYYTPNNYYCGCVATMMAQMMRYHEWPKTSVTPQTRSCMWGSDINTSSTMTSGKKTMMGGVYDWSKMTLTPDYWTSEASRQEIGKLCYDCGVSVSMMWSGTGSGAYLPDVRDAFVDVFGYSNAHLVMFASGFHDYNFEELKTIVISNCEAGLPVGYGISGSSAGGHAVVIDGYGYSESGEFYMHINPGWSGNSNAWYNPPNLTMGGYTFDSSDELVYNVFPEGTGAIVTGRVVDQHGAPVEGATVGGYLVYEEEIEVPHPLFPAWTQMQYVPRTNEVTSATTDANGKYHLKTGLTNVAATFHAKATGSRGSVSKTVEMPRSQTMIGYSTNGFSLGNKVNFDFTLPKLCPPKVLFR